MASSDAIEIKSFCFNYFRENCYLLRDSCGNCVIIDPGCYDSDETGQLTGYVEANSLRPVAIWLTHGHFDHIYGVASLVRKYGIPVMMAPEDAGTLELNEEAVRAFGMVAPDSGFRTVDLKDGQILRFAQDDSSPLFRVIATPGHTPGGVCFYDEANKILFSGDTLFAGSIGRTDLPGGDYDKEIVNIMEKLMLLPGDVEVFPGHGPSTSIAAERTGNPFLQPFNEPWETETEMVDI